MKSVKKTIAFLAVLFLFLGCVFAKQGSSNTLHVVAQVPENYGVAFPDNALRFGDFVFEVRFQIDTEIEVDAKDGRALITKDTISVGEIAPGLDSFDFTLVYYGNLSKKYLTEILVDPNIVWMLEGASDLESVPISVSLKRNDFCDEDIVCVSSREGQAYIEIPPTGPREGVPVLDVDVSWDGRKDLRPGKYIAELKLDLRVL